MKQIFSLAVFLCSLSVSGCPSGTSEHPMSLTHIQGRAPLNAGGKFYIYDSETTKVRATGDIDETGRFSVSEEILKDGPTLIAAEGGGYMEPSTQTVTHHDGQLLHAVVDVELFANHEVAISPWTEIAFSKAGVAGYKEAAEALTQAFGCQSPDYARLLEVSPALPTADKPVQSLSPEALSYLYLGALSQLAGNLSEEFGLQPGARLTSMRLAKAIAADFSDGRIDGRQNGARIWLTDGHALPENVLRQPLAQALRRFLKSPSNETSIRETAVLDLMQCVSQGSDLQIGPAGESLDMDGPDLEFVQPNEGGYLASAQDLICEARDGSGVKSLKTSIWRRGKELPTALGAQSTGNTGQAFQRLVAPILLEQLETGPLVARCEAEDNWGNPQAKIQSFHINRGGVAPRLLLGAEDGKRLSAAVQVTCDCSEDPYSHRCELTSLGTEGSLALVEQGDRWSRYAWETSRVLDGPHSLTCSSWTHGFAEPHRHSVMAHVKNNEPGSATGMVYLDTPVEHVAVTAYAYKNGSMGQELGSVEAPGGAFRVPITNEYRGPILLVAERSKNPAVEQPQARFHNVPLDAPMALSNGTLRLLIDHYDPGQSFTGLSINVASSMAESLAASIWKHQIDAPLSFYAASQGAHRLVGQYLNPTKPFDARRTKVANLRLRGRISDDDEVVLGLFHVGLSRLGAEYSIQHCQRRTCITVADIVEAMRRDIEDGRLDGLDVDHNRVRLGNGAFLGADFFRIELARAIRRWLDKAPFLDDSRETMNESGLATRDFTGRSHFLQHLAAHDSDLFGNRPGTHYDDNGPDLEVQVIGIDGRPMTLGAALGPTRFRVVVDARDESGVLWVRASANGIELENSQSSRSDHAEFWIDTAMLPDGETEIVIEARDGSGNNATPRYLRAVVDKVAPTVQLTREDVWIADGQNFRLQGTVSKPHLVLQVFAGDTLVVELAELPGTTRAFDIPVPLASGAHHLVRVIARDLAGNTGQAQQTVHCDSRPPSITTMNSFYSQEDTGAPLELVLRPQGEPIHAQDVPVLSKVWNRLDNRPEHNPPTVKFQVNDVPMNGEGIGTAVDSLRVSYKYVFSGGGATYERDWAPASCDSDGRCRVTFSYQTMLPTQISSLPITTARTQNFIARSSVEDLHSVLIRAEDAAGNATVMEWIFKLRLFSPPVEVDCNFDPNFTDARLSGLEEKGASVPAVAAEKFPSLYVNLKSALTTDESSLTPSGASHTFAFPETSLQWRFDRILQQVAILSERLERIPLAEWRRCPPDKGFTQAYDDGQCKRTGKSREIPIQWSWTREPHMGDLIASQIVRPQSAVVELRAGAESFHNPLFTVTQPQRIDGSFYSVQGAYVIQRTRHTQISYRLGYSYAHDEDEWRSLVGKRIDERRIVQDLRIVRNDPYLPVYRGSSSGTPAPLRIDYAPACTQALTASWRDDRPPVVSAGPAPVLHDLASGYGH